MSELNDKLLEIKRQKDTYILPENLKKDVTAFGVTGALESGAKIFDTIEHMQQDETAQDEDLSIVYREEIQPVQEDSEFDSCIFPNTVVLDSAFSSNIYGSFRSTDGDVFDGSVELSSSSFRFNGYGDIMIRVEYSSNDGITYTRTDGGEELQEFGTTIKWDNGMESFNSVIGNFMKIGGNYFDGLYEYKINVLDKTKKYISYLDDMVIDWGVGQTAPTSITLIPSNDVLNVEIFKPICQKVYDDIGDPQALSDFEVWQEGDNWYFAMYNNGVNTYLYRAYNLMYDRDTRDFLGLETYGDGLNYTCSIYKIDFENQTYILDRTATWLYVGTNYGYIPFSLNNLKTAPYRISITENMCVGPQYVRFVTTNQDTPIDFTYQYTDDYFYNAYFPCKSQLNATSDGVYEKTFYGKNGVENGTLTTNVSNLFTDVNAEVSAKLQMYYDTLTPRILTDQDKTVNQDMRFIPIKADGTALLDTSNVTNMYYMFSDCKNLITISLIDTSNVTNMKYMFNNCTSLVTIPQLNTSNVTNMNSMFYICSSLTTIPLLDTSNVTAMGQTFFRCSNLTSIPLLDTGNVTNMGSMFFGCSNLTTIPLLDTSNVTSMYGTFQGCTSLVTIPQLNTNKVTDMYGMFYGCTSLVTVPQLNTNSATVMQDMFKNCSSLSNTSLNNILQMCINAISYTKTKTLAYIGLTQEQATICQSLSNYSAFISAGWTTGY